MGIKEKSLILIWICLIGCINIVACQAETGATVAPQSNELTEAKIEPTETAVATETHLPTKTVPPTQSVALATATSLPTATETATTPPTPTLMPTPTPTVPLIIHSFNATSEDYLATSKNITFTWAISGATQMRIYGGTHQYSTKWWDVSGTYYVVPLGSTIFRNPTMTMVAANGLGDVASETIVIPWQCEYEYFFTPKPIQCPWHEPSNSVAIDQQFQNGRMIWIEQIRSGTQVREDRVYVFQDGGNGYGVWHRFDSVLPTSETFAEPAPAGFAAPQNRFGRVWQEDDAVQRDLGWALAGEASFETTWQWQLRESDPPVAYVRTIDGRIIELYGRTSGGWQYLDTGN